jgi:hypothetical protein
VVHLGLVDSVVIGSRINLEQEIPSLDQGVFLVTLAYEVAGDLGADLGVDVADRGPKPFLVERDIFLDHWRDLDLRRLRRRRDLRCILAPPVSTMMARARSPREHGRVRRTVLAVAVCRGQ